MVTRLQPRGCHPRDHDMHAGQLLNPLDNASVVLRFALQDFHCLSVGGCCFAMVDMMRLADAR